MYKLGSPKGFGELGNMHAHFFRGIIMKQACSRPSGSAGITGQEPGRGKREWGYFEDQQGYFLAKF